MKTSENGGLYAQLLVMRFFLLRSKANLPRYYEAEAKRCFLSTRLAERPIALMSSEANGCDATRHFQPLLS